MRRWSAAVVIVCVIVALQAVYRRPPTTLAGNLERLEVTERANSDGQRVLPKEQRLRSNESANNTSAAKASATAVRAVMQRSREVRETAFHFSQSNDVFQVIAAQGALIYCAEVAGAVDVSPTTHARRSFWLDSNMKGLRPASTRERAEIVSSARERCDTENVQANALDRQLRSSIGEKLVAYNELVAELQRLPTLNLNTLSAQSKALLLDGDGAALSATIDQLTAKLSGSGATDSEMFANILATQLAACQLGDSCDELSFRKQLLCLRWGACAGGSVAEAVQALLLDRNDLQQSVDRGAARLRESIQSIRK